MKGMKIKAMQAQAKFEISVSIRLTRRHQFTLDGYMDQEQLLTASSVESKKGALLFSAFQLGGQSGISSEALQFPDEGFTLELIALS